MSQPVLMLTSRWDVNVWSLTESSKGQPHTGRDCECLMQTWVNVSLRSSKTGEILVRTTPKRGWTGAVGVYVGGGSDLDETVENLTLLMENMDPTSKRVTQRASSLGKGRKRGIAAYRSLS